MKDDRRFENLDIEEQNSKLTPDDDAENRIQRRARIIKSASMLIFAAVLLIIAAIAWFTMLKETEADNMRVQVASDNFVINSVNNSSDGLYYDPYHQIIQNNSADGSLVWGMTSESNINNYDIENAGIEPGSYGKVSFVITPRVSSVTVDFTFDLIGYNSETVEESGSERIEMNEITKESLKNNLNGHILLFENCEVRDGKRYYSGLIASDQDMKRVLTKTYTAEALVDIYWVWPEHFSNLVNASETERPIFDMTPPHEDYNAMIEHICAYPTYYLKGNATDPALQNLTEQKLIDGYGSTYGGLYDGADNDIGAGVEYVLLRMTVSDD